MLLHSMSKSLKKYTSISVYTKNMSMNDCEMPVHQFRTCAPIQSASLHRIVLD